MLEYRHTRRLRAPSLETRPFSAPWTEAAARRAEVKWLLRSGQLTPLHGQRTTSPVTPAPFSSLHITSESESKVGERAVRPREGLWSSQLTGGGDKSSRKRRVRILAFLSPFFIYQFRFLYFVITSEASPVFFAGGSEHLQKCCSNTRARVVKTPEISPATLQAKVRDCFYVVYYS